MCLLGCIEIVLGQTAFIFKRKREEEVPENAFIYLHCNSY